MSTDSTELTFVRCPSCRSLVPAVSTRCRMCGAALDPAAKVDEAEEAEKRSGRVRQKTMSQAHSELSATAGQIRDEMGGTPAEEDPFGLVEEESSETGEAAEGNADPLGDYIQEVDEESKMAAEQPAPTIKPAPAGPRSNGPTPPAGADEMRPLNAGASEGRERESRREQPREERAPREEPRSRVSIESGGRQHNKPSGLNFSRREEKREERREERGREERGGSEQPRQGRQQEGPRFNREARRQEEAPPRRERQHEAGEEPRSRQHGGGGAPADHRSRDNDPQRRSGQELSESAGDSPGRLFGWLVSFETPEGSAIELREGKFFVTGSQLKKNDLVISGKNLSTPHGMVSVGRDQGFRVQDLMSESGTYIRRRTGQSYQREEGVVTVEHGDWIKFGNAEFVVAIVAFGK